jgi:hypothetical protein
MMLSEAFNVMISILYQILLNIRIIHILTSRFTKIEPKTPLEEAGRSRSQLSALLYNRYKFDEIQNIYTHTHETDNRIKLVAFPSEQADCQL